MIETSNGAASRGRREGMGRRLRALRLNAGLAESEMAEALGLATADYTALEADLAPLRPALLPALAEVLDTPLAPLLAELHAAPHSAAELHTLTQAFNAIPSAGQREALLNMALMLGETPAA